MYLCIMRVKALCPVCAPPCRSQVASGHPEVVLALLFLQPGRHAGPGGDIDTICAAAIPPGACKCGLVCQQGRAGAEAAGSKEWMGPDTARMAVSGGRCASWVHIRVTYRQTRTLMPKGRAAWLPGISVRHTRTLLRSWRSRSRRSSSRRAAGSAAACLEVPSAVAALVTWAHSCIRALLHVRTGGMAALVAWPHSSMGARSGPCA